MPDCNACGLPCDTFDELAHHIIKNRKTHRSSQKWAASYIHRHNLNKRDFGGATPLTEAQKDHYAETRREISGLTRRVVGLCPRCKTLHERQVEEEYYNDKNTWKYQGRLVLTCASCGGF